jgi:hypothetical protein
MSSFSMTLTSCSIFCLISQFSNSEIHSLISFFERNIFLNIIQSRIEIKNKRKSNSLTQIKLVKAKPIAIEATQAIRFKIFFIVKKLLK